MGHISLARIEVDPSTHAHSLLQDAEIAVEQSASLTGSLLAFAKGGEPRLELHDIRVLTEEASQLTTSGTAVTLNANLEETLWSAEVDGNQIKQLISNLVLNAIQAMDGEGEVRVVAKNFVATDDISTSARAGDYVHIQVIDTGNGIADNIRDKVLDPYFTTKPEGSGLGLASAFSIANRHHGWLEFTSETGYGTTFNVYLPAKRQSAPTVAAERVELEMGEESILVMDDDKAVQRVYSNALTRLGYAVTLADDGQSAVAIYADALRRGGRFDLVIMDLTVPGGMGGKEAMRQILELDAHAIGIVASGYSNDPVLSLYKEAGFAGALSKPFTLAALSTLLREVLSEVQPLPEAKSG